MNSSDIEMWLSEYYQLLQESLGKFPSAEVTELVRRIEDARCSDHRVYVFGNGGSSATASHFASDLTKGASNSAKPKIKAQCLSDATPAMTAWANDTDYSNIFAGQLEGLGEKGDIAIGISVGGNSPNVVEGLRKAKELGMLCVVIVGAGGGTASEIADIIIKVPERDTERVEDLHSVVCHSVTGCLRNLM